MSEIISPNRLGETKLVRPKPELDTTLPYLGEQGEQLTAAVIEDLAAKLAMELGGEQADYLDRARGMIENMEPTVLRIHQRFFHWQQELQVARQRIMSMLSQAGETRFSLEELEASLFKIYDVYDVDTDDIPAEDIDQIRSFVEAYKKQMNIPVSVESLCDYLQKKVLFENASKQREDLSMVTLLSDDFVTD